MRFNSFMTCQIREPIEPGKLHRLQMRHGSVVVSAERREGWIHIVHTHRLIAKPVTSADDRVFFFASCESLIDEACNPCVFWCEVREQSGALTGLYLFEHTENGD